MVSLTVLPPCCAKWQPTSYFRGKLSMLKMVAQNFFPLAWSKPWLILVMLHAYGNIKHCGSKDNRIHSRAITAKWGQRDIPLNTLGKKSFELFIYTFIILNGILQNRKWIWLFTVNLILMDSLAATLLSKITKQF